MGSGGGGGGGKQLRKLCAVLCAVQYLFESLRNDDADPEENA